jgi:hypothetical protein
MDLCLARTTYSTKHEVRLTRSHQVGQYDHRMSIYYLRHSLVRYLIWRNSTSNMFLYEFMISLKADGKNVRKNTMRNAGSPGTSQSANGTLCRNAPKHTKHSNTTVRRVHQKSGVHIAPGFWYQRGVILLHAHPSGDC